MTNPNPNLTNQFKPGQCGNPNGRPKGSRNKMGKGFIQDLSKHWQEHGEVILAKCIKQSRSAPERVETAFKQFEDALAGLRAVTGLKDAPGEEDKADTVH